MWLSYFRELFMAKSENENVYFPHYVSARNDRKIKRLRKELNVEGYGIFFMLLEVLREQSDLKYPMDDMDLLADEFGTSEQKLRVVICNYGLFEIDENEKFFSPKQIEYLQPFFKRSKRAKHAALLRWNNKESDANAYANAYANALPEQCVSNALAMQGKERKGKESSLSRTHDENSDVYIDEVESSQREHKVMQLLSTTVIPEEEKRMYYLRLESNGFCKIITGKYHRLKESQIRSDAEYCYKKGWLETSKPKSQDTQQNYKTVGGYWND